MGFLNAFSLEHYELRADSDELEAAIQKKNNQNAAALYAYIGIIIVAFTLANFLRGMYIQNKNIRRDLRILATPARAIRSFFIKKAFWPWTTRGQMAVVIGYLVVNLLLCIMSSEGSKLPFLQMARQTGWLSIVNFVLLLLLSMKNTPLAKMTGYSWERLNALHRWVGLVAWIEGSVHTIAIGIATSRLHKDGMSQSYILLKWENIMGWVALCLWTIMMLAFPLFKTKAFELFYMIHILFYPLVAVTLFLHNRHCRIPVLVAVSLYALDRLIRSDRWHWHNKNSRQLKATLETTEDGATLVTVPRNGALDWAPGSHAFLSIPRIRAFESHPLSIASINDNGTQKTVQFLIRPKSGFTKALFEEARKTPAEMKRGYSKDVTAYIDGPYGAMPDFNTFNHVFLIAAGSGITYTLPIALELVRRHQVRSLDFIWAIKSRDSIETVRDELEEIARYSRTLEEGSAVNLRIQITGRQHMLPRQGTFERVMGTIRRGGAPPPRVSGMGQYDLFASEMAMPMPQRDDASIRSSMTSSYQGPYTDGSSTPTPATWTGMQHTRSISGDSAFSVRSYQDTLNNERDSSVRVTSGAPLLSPPVASPKPRSGRRHSSVAGSPGLTSPPMPSPGSDASEDGYRWAPVVRPRAVSQTMTGEDITESPSSMPLMSPPGPPVEPDSPSLTPPMIKSERSRDPLKRYFHFKRPDISKLILDTIRNADDNETIAFGACGVYQMTAEVRATVAKEMNGRGPSLSVYCEEFGY